MDQRKIAALKNASFRARPFRAAFRTFAGAAVLAGLALPVPAQDIGPPPEASPIRVLVESPAFNLGDWPAAIPFAEPSPLDKAHVVIAVKTEAPGVFAVVLTGRAEFEGQGDGFTHESPSGQSEDDVRAALLQKIKLALLRFVSKTPLSGRISISLLDQVKPTAVADPWNFWVFSLGLNGFLNGERTYAGRSWMGNCSAGRVTPEWKIRLSLSGHVKRDVFRVGDYRYESSSHGLGFNGMAVKSLTDHWSAGGFVNLSSSTYQNIGLSLQTAAAVEYDIFPYSESTKHQLRILYRVGATNVRYREETIFDKTRETLWSESLSATLEVKRPWGTVSATLLGQHYFHDFGKNRLQLNGQLSFRVFRGLKFNLDGGGSRVRDQLFLAKGGSSLEEVLLRRRQLATTYDYFFSIGLSYTFGSIFSNIVNPRFGSGSGTSIRLSF